MNALGVLEACGLVAFATSGALAAVRHRFDLVGVLALSIVTAVGGGALRDVGLGDLPPAVLLRPSYLLIPVATGVVAMGFHHQIDAQLRRPVLVFDALGLGLFCVSGTAKAIDFQIPVLGAVALGVITATGGGVLRDVLTGERPAMFRADSVLYSIPAALGALAIVVAARVGLRLDLVGAVTAFAVAALRLAALRFGWRAPKPSS